MASNFLDKTGLTYFYNKIKALIDKKQDTLTAGTGIDITDNVVSADKNLFYGTCATAGSTATKIVECADWKLEDGNTIIVKFTYSNTTSSAMSLNVNGTGDIPVGVILNPINFWRAGGAVEFTYDATANNYLMVDTNLATTSYYGVTKLSDSTSSTSTQRAATANSVRLAYNLANSKQDKLTAGTGIDITDNVISASGGASGLRLMKVTLGYSSEEYIKYDLPYIKMATNATYQFEKDTELTLKFTDNIVVYAVPGSTYTYTVSIPIAFTYYSSDGGSSTTETTWNFVCNISLSEDLTQATVAFPRQTITDAGGYVSGYIKAVPIYGMDDLTFDVVSYEG